MSLTHAIPEQDRSFRAWNVDGRNTHLIPNVYRIDEHRLRGSEWPATRCLQGLSSNRMSELVEKKLHNPSSTTTCEHCTSSSISPERTETYNLGLLPSSDPLCTISCYHDFTASHFSHPLIELRGPGPLGYGAFVRRGITIKKDQWVGEYIGELRPIKRVNRDLKIYGKQSMYRFDIPVEGKEDVVVVDSEQKGNWSRFVNSSCGANLIVWATFVGKRHVLLLRAKKDIKEGEELTFSYGKAYFDAAGISCRCGAREGMHMPGSWRK
ncbi:uncharacterized protein RCC_10962 [Ramularia collo-cygni]|uniref:SET domain-containing protein n=1 Tax=Ramularia collo-cygni TaxID=112498 RepID=A0A2D3VAY4_9PEZI|nr:uncharacterized protein RCC_10962 [Ramularia collo-cygni]CZT25233.1 uncharacterized protein RCC_10962 [Ramularia collo-cygni]